MIAGELLLTRCMGCFELTQHTLPATYRPNFTSEIEVELCPLCHEQLQCGDKRLRELIELRLLLR